MKMAKIGPFLFLLNTPTPRRRALSRRRSLRLGEPEPRVSTLSSPPRLDSALPRRTSPPRRSIASPRRACKFYFSSSFLLMRIIISEWKGAYKYNSYMKNVVG